MDRLRRFCRSSGVVRLGGYRSGCRLGVTLPLVPSTASTSLRATKRQEPEWPTGRRQTRPILRSTNPHRWVSATRSSTDALWRSRRSAGVRRRFGATASAGDRPSGTRSLAPVGLSGPTTGTASPIDDLDNRVPIGNPQSIPRIAAQSLSLSCCSGYSFRRKRAANTVYPGREMLMDSVWTSSVRPPFAMSGSVLVAGC